MTPADREFIARLCAERGGLKIDPDKDYLLENRLSPVARREGFASVHELILAVRNRAEEPLVCSVVAAMSPSETSFFRDPAAFEDLVGGGLADLARQRGDGALRIWVAACGTGQEVYSLAMLLSETPVAGVVIDLVASDICERRLEKAQTGVYSHFEVQRGLSAHRLVRHFEGKDEGFVLSPRVRSLVRWRRANLMEDISRFGRFDVVICRGLLPYLDPAGREQVLANLNAALTPDGRLMLGGPQPKAAAAGLQSAA